MANRRLSVVFGTALMAVALVASSAAPTFAHSGKVFGAKLATNTQPSNSMPGRTCDNPNAKCTWIMVDAFKRPGTRFHGSRAPRNGTIKKIRLIAGGPGSFRLQLAQVKKPANGDLRNARARITRSGRLINYQGQPDANEPYVIESFKLNLKVKKGEHLALKARRMRAVRCTSGGPETLLFQPSLKVGGPFKKAGDNSGCNLLIQAILK
jgi:hypothetical protein